MGLMDHLRGKLVYLDTVVIIYLLERHPKYYPLVRRVWNDKAWEKTSLVTSALSRFEASILPFRNRDAVLLGNLGALMQRPELNVRAIDDAVLSRAAQLRGDHPSLKPPDAIHLATAHEAAADVFLTNDARLKSHHPGLILLDDHPQP
jgi:predicted nucleic acid-binding protein